MADRIETATSGRAKCRACSAKIDKGELRFGEASPNPFGEGETQLWFHLRCAADRRPGKLKPVLEAFALEENGDPAELSALMAIVDAGLENPQLEKVGHAERASSGRARCRHCRQLIEKGALRVKVEVFEEGMMNPLGFVHAECSSYRFGTAGLVARLQRWSPSLTAEDLREFEGLLAEGAAQDPAAAHPSEESA